jgi:anti-sigma regulatory factor (Ser/Thr protein kinase)
MTGTPLRIGHRLQDGVTVVVPDGVLDLVSYGQLRDALIKYALEVPRAVVVDVGSLHVPTSPTLAVFSAVWMRVSEWPGVPMMIVAADPEDRQRLARNGINRYVPVYADLDDALRALDASLLRRRVIMDLIGPVKSSLVARRFVERTCRGWSCGTQLTEDAVLVVNALVENAIRHAPGEPSVRLELRPGVLTVAVYDDGPPFTRPDAAGPQVPLRLGLMLVEGLASAWGCARLPFGRKAVWAALRPLDHRT